MNIFRKLPVMTVPVTLLFVSYVILLTFSGKGHSAACRPGIKQHIPVYIINHNLHTGIVIPVDSSSVELIPVLNMFKGYSHVDIGWGDEDFYQTPGAGLILGIKALMVPTSSVVRIEGFDSDINDITGWSDFTILLDFDSDQYRRLCMFINSSIKNNRGGIPETASVRDKGRVIYFKSVHRYHLFNTCNTWAASAIQAAGFGISPFFVITASQFYKELKPHGRILKALRD